MADNTPLGSSTRALHADDPLNVVTDVAPPLHLSTTFRYPDNPDDLAPATKATYDLDPTTHIYSRHTAPNYSRFETILSSLLNGHAVSYSSGLAAFNAALTLLNPRRIAIGQAYHGCHGVIEIFSRLTGLERLDLDCPAEQLQAGDVIHLETPVNPHGTAFNIQSYADKAHSRGAYLIVDSTFAPPGLQDPFQFGADLVMHSGSKYFGGHSDLLCGVLATQNPKWAKQLHDDRLFLGSVMGNMEGWLGVRSLRTLEIRVQRASQSAASLVSWLDGILRVPHATTPGSDEAAVQAVVHRVFHASLQQQEDDPAWLQRQMPNGFGPVFAIVLREEDLARRLPSHLSFFHHATSLGGVESLIEWRAMSDSTVDPRLLRVSIGLENWEDLRRDLLGAFKALAATVHSIMSFIIHYFSTASSFTGKHSESLPAPLPLSRLFAVLEERYPGITEKVLDSCSVSLGDEYVDVQGNANGNENVIREGDEVGIIPPVSSG
ncbi:hypothetical protein ASPZODRAFT_148962 [Penicilliopsis zonata CBS 506.65]|uniref:Molybdopterin synthase sulfur carrier subunit n=1 Tax=Penicilliopsis zonata CBS 506.65 TaxID=1073090 RepID=A0A1L9SX07_9EURO|nr:hypothetical protein ASPZODRAFT_148962 [Penicilliopsis zonata CBS 506.65]OJJ51738.1 hypothetical protein ASPZODRAFT_148962 [Penicilliopsis zonata CBS 506.65]